MFVVRLLHALWSLLVIYFGYKIALQFGNKTQANRVGWILALFWIFPFLSVRNLVEYVCVPLMMYATWLVIQPRFKQSSYIWLLAGFVFGIAFNIRFQTILFTGGIGLVMLYQKKWLQTILVVSGVLAAIVLIQGGTDYLVWGKPFVQLEAYFKYNMTHSGEYTTGPWYHYILFIVLAMIPPVSIYLILGYFQGFRKMLILFIPVFVFIAFHSWYPNKQERFISTILPFFIIIGVIGWGVIEQGLFNPNFIKKWIKRTWIFFWVVNFILMIPVTTMYSKKARVEAMEYLSNYHSLNYFIIENSARNVLPFPPQFYLTRFVNYDALMQMDDFDEFKTMKDWQKPENQPQFILFSTPNKLESRVDRMKTLFPDLMHEITIEPGRIDKLIHWLNPINDNQNIYIYRNEAVQKKGIN